jgi:hypothetical protein
VCQVASVTGWSVLVICQKQGSVGLLAVPSSSAETSTYHKDARFEICVKPGVVARDVADASARYVLAVKL